MVIEIAASGAVCENKPAARAARAQWVIGRVTHESPAFGSEPPDDNKAILGFADAKRNHHHRPIVRMISTRRDAYASHSELCFNCVHPAPREIGSAAGRLCSVEMGIHLDPVATAINASKPANECLDRLF
jgi:hypothetical protein